MAIGLMNPISPWDVPIHDRRDVCRKMYDSLLSFPKHIHLFSKSYFTHTFSRRHGTRNEMSQPSLGSVPGFDYNASVHNLTKNYISRWVDLKDKEGWKNIVSTAYTLLTKNQLIGTKFNEPAAKDILKLIAQELIELYPDVFAVVLDSWAQKAAQGIIKICKTNTPQYAIANETGESSKSAREKSSAPSKDINIPPSESASVLTPKKTKTPLSRQTTAAASSLTPLSRRPTVSASASVLSIHHPSTDDEMDEENDDSRKVIESLAEPINVLFLSHKI